MRRHGKVLCLESLDGRKTYFLVGRRTVFSPKRWPSVGDRLRVKYHIQAYPHKTYGRYYVGYEVTRIPDIEKAAPRRPFPGPAQKLKPTVARPQGTQKPPGPAKAQPSCIKIDQIRTLPATVRAGSDFDVEISYTASGPKPERAGIAVVFTFSILKDGRALYTAKPEKLMVASGKKGQIIKHLTAAKKKGAYVIRVSLRIEDSEAVGTLVCQIE